jgi:hypothetical protein
LCATRFLNRSEYNIASNGNSVGPSPGNNLLLLLAQLLDAEPDGVAGLEEDGLGLLAGTDSRRRAGRNDVARLQRQKAADVARLLPPALYQ